MKFRITRTSQLDSGYIDALCEEMPKPPCEGAKLEFEKFAVRGTIETAKSGEKKLVKKMFREYGFCIDIDTLDDLIALSNRCGSLIVNSADKNEPPHIEIYDDYRE